MKMNNSTKLSRIVGKHLLGKESLDIGQITRLSNDLNNLVVEIRKGESTIESAMDRFANRFDGEINATKTG